MTVHGQRCRIKCMQYAMCSIAFLNMKLDLWIHYGYYISVDNGAIQSIRGAHFEAATNHRLKYIWRHISTERRAIDGSEKWRQHRMLRFAREKRRNWHIVIADGHKSSRRLAIRLSMHIKLLPGWNVFSHDAMHSTAISTITRKRHESTNCVSNRFVELLS